MSEKSTYSLGEYAAMMIKSLEYKDDIPKFVNYIKTNKEYFPSIQDKDLEEILKNYKTKNKNN